MNVPNGARDRFSADRDAEIRDAGWVTTSRVIWAVNDEAKVRARRRDRNPYTRLARTFLKSRKSYVAQRCVRFKMHRAGRYAPSVYPRFIAARQQTEEFDFTWLNAVHIPVYFVSLAALPILVGLSGNRVRRPAAALALFVFFALLGNAAICGAVASAYDRYQSRLAALAPLAVAIAALGWRRARRSTAEHIPG
jgi:hypothetical protein